MKILRGKRKEHRGRTLSALLAAALFCAASCGSDFEDDSMAELKKPELLSIVLEPPEAAPGDEVRASFLLADEKGVLQGVPVFWIPAFDLADRGGRRRSDTGEAHFDADQDLAALMAPEFSMTVAEEDQHDFDEQGFAEHTIGVVAFTGEASALDVLAESDLDDLDALVESGDLGALLDSGDLDELLDSGDVKLGIRTLVVSDRTDKNQNPRVTDIKWGRNAERQPNEVQLVTSGDADMAALRQAAADDPVEVEEKRALHFGVRVEDDDAVEEAIRYQWIATGGDFGGFRQRVQKWEAPDFRKPDPDNDEEDQSGQSDVNPRTDPNLHAVWVVVRDSGIAGQLGQGWAEFYVRVVPADDD